MALKSIYSLVKGFESNVSLQNYHRKLCSRTDIRRPEKLSDDSDGRHVYRYPQRSNTQRDLSHFHEPTPYLEKDIPVHQYDPEYSYLSPENIEFLAKQIKMRSEEKHTFAMKHMQPITPTDFIPLQTVRTGLVGVKFGTMKQFWKSGKSIRCTVIHIPDQYVLDVKTYQESDDKWRKDKQLKKQHQMLIAAIDTEAEFVNEKLWEQFNNIGIPPQKVVTRFEVSTNGLLPLGTRLNVRHFTVGQYVDIVGRSQDKGFQGVMKRWGMKGGPASHGSTKFHRRVGALGGGQSTAHTWKGKKMPGRMGNNIKIVQGMKVCRMIPSLGLIYVPGLIPGYIGQTLQIFDTKYTDDKRVEDAPCPTYLDEDVGEEMIDPVLFNLENESISYPID